jgi:Cd2+/Zn2+-exporting ATPase
MIDTSALTGESVPRSVSEGEEIISGCVNGEGVLYAEVLKRYEDSTVARILELVENASEKKAVTEKFITRFARYYTPAVVFAALAIAVIPPIFAGDFRTWLYRACTFLVVSCPCALVISVPMSFFCGIGSSSKNGILVKGSNYLELLAQMDTVVFDKTGTLTKGEFKVTAIVPTQGVSEAKLLETAALAESFSTHPVAAAIRTAWNNASEQRVTDVSEIAGHGIKAVIDGKTVYAGNKKLMDSAGIDTVPVSDAGTVIYVGMENEFLGYIVIADSVKDGAADALKKMKKLGVKQTVMLTGDKYEAAQSVAAEIGVDSFYAELLPADKVSRIEALLESGSGKVAFAGDGINDAPVLMRSDIGIAMGSMGSDAAIEAADVVLMDDNLMRIPLAIRIARKTTAIVKQNIIFAIGVKFAILILTAFGYANMWAAVFADVGVAVIAILNAMRALYIKE